MAGTINWTTILRPGLAVCLALAVLSGCATYQANRADVTERIQTLLSDKEYGQALATIELVKPDHPDYQRIQAWRTVIEKNARKWQAELIYEADQLRQAGQWYNAGQLFEDGAAKLPPSEEFDQARRRFEIRRAAYRYRLDLHLALAHGRGLPDEIAALEQLYALDPTNDAMRRDIEAKQQQLIDSRVRLVDCGRDSLVSGNSERAAICLKVARRIAQSDDVDRMLASMQRDQDAENNKKRIASQKLEEQKQARRFEDLLDSYEKTLRSGDLFAAREQIDRLIIMQPRNADLHKQRATLNARIESRVAKSLEDGREFYTQGNFEDAHAAWVAGLQLDPDNEELKTSIARAERVLDKLRQLSDQQSTTN